MIHLITDNDIMAHIEGTLNNGKEAELYQKMADNGEIELLRHIEKCYVACQEDYFNDLLGEKYSSTTAAERDYELRMAAKCLSKNITNKP